jgi:hypothetical protein
MRPILPSRNEADDQRGKVPQVANTQRTTTSHATTKHDDDEATHGTHKASTSKEKATQQGSMLAPHNSRSQPTRGPPQHLREGAPVS